MRSYFVLFCTILLLSCNKDKNVPFSQTFPNTVGNQWVYQYKDGHTTADQYIYVNIVGTGTLPDGQGASIWTTTLQDKNNNRYLIDSSFVVADDKKVVFYAAPCRTCTPPMFDEKRRFIFPLQVGNMWFTDKVFGDTTKVLNKGKLTVPAGSFDNTFKLAKTLGYVTNSYTKDSVWLTSNVGITRYYQNQYSLGPVPGNGIWELISYQLK